MAGVMTNSTLLVTAALQQLEVSPINQVILLIRIKHPYLTVILSLA
jgi:hypothetical protein